MTAAAAAAAMKVTVLTGLNPSPVFALSTAEVVCASVVRSAVVTAVSAVEVPEVSVPAVVCSVVFSVVSADVAVVVTGGSVEGSVTVVTGGSVLPVCSFRNSIRYAFSLLPSSEAVTA